MFEIIPTLLIVVLFTTALPSAVSHGANTDAESDAAPVNGTSGAGTGRSTTANGLVHPLMDDGDSAAGDLIDPSTPTMTGGGGGGGYSRPGRRAGGAVGGKHHTQRVDVDVEDEDSDEEYQTMGGRVPAAAPMYSDGTQRQRLLAALPHHQLCVDLRVVSALCTRARRRRVR